jgi:hypothetical protein
MAIQMSIAVRNARLDQVEAIVGTAAKLLIYDLAGAAPADCAASIVATTLATLNLPIDWMNPAAGGIKTLLGSWSTTATGAGTADFFRLMANDGVTCGVQGTVGLVGTDMILDNTNVAVGQTINVITFALTDANA